MKKVKKQKNSLIYYTTLLIAVLLGIIYLFYNNNQYGFLQISSLDENIAIFIDNKKAISERDINPNFKLKNGEHTIIVSKENFWPWTQTIKIKRKETVATTPFFVPQNTSGVLIGASDPEYANILSLFQKNIISQKAFEKIADKNLELKSKIKALDFYKNRIDVIIVAVATEVFALEIEGEDVQNLQPVYTGKNPVFVKKDNNSIYILDDNNLMLVNY
ncbi:MAG: PEGA domain-containing protein [Patescibacteria group bacterium]